MILNDAALHGVASSALGQLVLFGLVGGAREVSYIIIMVRVSAAVAAGVASTVLTAWLAR
jgi:hypothetical protein